LRSVVTLKFNSLDSDEVAAPILTCKLKSDKVTTAAPKSVAPILASLQYLVVPPALEFEANSYIKSQNWIITGGDTIAGTTTKVPEYNAFSRMGLQVLAPPYLSNSSYTGYSAVAWYLWGDPRRNETFQLGYLKGKERPHLASGPCDYTRLGFWFQTYHDVGIREQDHRSMYKSKGAA